MNNVKGLFFDVGGTVFDWKSTARERIQELADAKGAPVDSESLATDWREEMMKVHTQVRYGNLPWMNTDEINRRALDNLMESYPLLATIDRMSLAKATWHHLKVFPGAPDAINRLRTRYTVVVLTILSWESIVNSSKEARVQWDGILSCEFLGYYKPSLQTYIKATDLLGLRPEQAMMVAAHRGDLAAAQSTGMHTAFVQAPEEDNVDAGFGKTSEGTKFDVEADGFDALCRQLRV